MLRLAARAGPLSSVLRCGAPALLRPALATRAVRPCVPIPVLRAASRCCSGTAAGGGDSGKKEADDKVFEGQVFEGAKNKVVTTIKKVSIANLGFAIASVPVLQYITAASGNPGKGVAMSALLLFFGGGTTGALTWATTTYVLAMHTVPGKDALLITTPTLMGGTTETEVAWADISRPIGYHPFATFEANGKKFYLDELGEMFDDTFPEKLEEALNK